MRATDVVREVVRIRERLRQPKQSVVRPFDTDVSSDPRGRSRQQQNPPLQRPPHFRRDRHQHAVSRPSQQRLRRRSLSLRRVSEAHCPRLFSCRHGLGIANHHSDNCRPSAGLPNPRLAFLFD